MMQVPLIPNQPLLQAEPGPMGPLQLRRHVRLGLLENSAFDPNRLDFDISYIATQAASPDFLEQLEDDFDAYGFDMSYQGNDPQVSWLSERV